MCVPYARVRSIRNITTALIVEKTNITSAVLFVTMPIDLNIIEVWRFYYRRFKFILMKRQAGSPNDEIFSRIDGLFETDVLKDKLVTVIGLGSGGSFVSVELARCGVSRFYLADFDQLEIHNVARHACGMRDVGKYKTEAIMDAILNINPAASIQCFNIDVTKEKAVLKQMIKDCDVLLACTDSEYTKYIINEICIELWQEEGVVVPAIYAGAYERAFGGDVIRVIPGETPCYDCVIGSIQQLEFYKSKPLGPVAYSNFESAEEFHAEPGLGLDVHFIALIQAKVALLTLLRDTDSILEDVPYNFLLWGNRKEWIFPEPFKCIYAHVHKRKNCPTCAKWVFPENELGMNREEIEGEAKDLLDTLPKVDLPLP